MAPTQGPRVRATLPGGTSFTVTADALEMIHVFGGTLHCYEGAGGCRSTGLYFSRTLPRKPVHSELTLPPGNDADPANDPRSLSLENVLLTVSNGLAPKLDGAVLDFGDYNRMQRFIWLDLPQAQSRRCSCRRSFGHPAGKRSPCLDQQRVGFIDV